MGALSAYKVVRRKTLGPKSNLVARAFVLQASAGLIFSREKPSYIPRCIPQHAPTLYPFRITFE